MPISALTELEVRTGGNDNNGGGFVAGGSGTDWSQQNSPQYALTGIASAGSGNTILSTLAAADMVGNIAQVTGGTNFNTGFFQVTSVSVGVSITFSTNNAGQSICTGVGASGVINIGGGLLTITQAQTASQTGNIIWIRSGTYTLTTGLTVPNTSLSYMGYGSTHGDLGTKPLLTTSTNSLNIFTDVASGVTDLTINNLSMSSTAGTKGSAIAAVTRNITGLTVANCKMSGFTTGINGDDNVTFYINNLQVINTEIASCSAEAILASGYFFGCYIHANSGDGWTLSHAVQTSQGSVFSRCVFSGNNHGINVPFIGSDGSIFVENCTFYNQTSDGILCSGTVAPGRLGFVNNIFYSNGGYGINMSSATATVQPGINQNNAYGANSTAARNGVLAGPGDVTLSGNPFNGAGSGDFSLNSTSGAGGACRDAGFPGAIGGSGSTGSVDIGAIQSAGGGGAHGSAIIQ